MKIKKHKISDWIYFKKNAILNKSRAITKYFFFNRLDIILGYNIIIKRGKGKHFFGKKNIIFDNSIFEVHNSKACITTGYECFFSYGVVVVCNLSITIGNNVWIGEYTSIRDSTHDFSAENPLGYNSDITTPIIIGNNVWIGRGCLIMQGTIIQDNVIIAANSVVKGKCITNSIYGGSPAKFIKFIKS